MSHSRINKSNCIGSSVKSLIDDVADLWTSILGTFAKEKNQIIVNFWVWLFLRPSKKFERFLVLGQRLMPDVAKRPKSEHIKL
uniref:Uncharacterized protein n=1 Tax=Romanomermis culicivorax TaxID=13658 RepID=A0A915IJG9_ROMCU